MPPPTIVIRPAVAADYEALCVLWEELDEHHLRARPDLFRPPQGARRDRHWFLAQIAAPQGAVLAAESAAGRLVGMAALSVQTQPELPVRIVRPHVEIDNLVVAAAHRRRGVVRRLIAAALVWTKAQGLGEIELTVHEFNEDALAFYRAAGFRTPRRSMGLPVGSTPC